MLQSQDRECKRLRARAKALSRQLSAQQIPSEAAEDAEEPGPSTNEHNSLPLVALRRENAQLREHVQALQADFKTACRLVASQQPKGCTADAATQHASAPATHDAAVQHACVPCDAATRPGRKQAGEPGQLQADWETAQVERAKERAKLVELQADWETAQVERANDAVCSGIHFPPAL